MGLLDRIKGHNGGNVLDTSGRTSNDPGILEQEDGVANVNFDHTTADTDAIMNNPDTNCLKLFSWMASERHV